MYNIVLDITTALYMGSVYHEVLYLYSAYYNTSPYEGYIVSVHRMVMENRPVDPGSIQGSHRPLSFIRIKHRTRADDILCKTNHHIVGLDHKNHIIRTCMMYHAA